MFSGKRIEQVILTRSNGSVEALIVTESPSGARQRERWPALAHDLETAIDRVAMQLARRGDVDGVAKAVRVRVGRGETLVTRRDLADRLRTQWHEEGD